MRVRIVASGVAIAVLAGVAVPTALSGPASAAGTTAAPTITTCAPATATMGKNVTIHGTALANATKIAIDGHVVTALKNGAKSIRVPVPTGIKQQSTVKVVTANGTATGQCAFKHAKKKSHK